MTRLGDKDLAVSLATALDEAQLIELSQQGQDTWTQSGSLQKIGPLEQELIARAVEEESALILKTRHFNGGDATVIGCALVRFLEPGYFAAVETFNMQNFPQPWLYLHWIILQPRYQGRGVGAAFVNKVVENITRKRPKGTLFLDCWAGK